MTPVATSKDNPENHETAQAFRDLADAIRGAVLSQSENMAKLEQTVGRLAVLAERQLGSDDAARRKAARQVGKDKVVPSEEVVARVESRLRRIRK